MSSLVLTIVFFVGVLIGGVLYITLENRDPK